MGAFALVLIWRDAHLPEAMVDAERALGGFANAGWRRIEAEGFRGSCAIDRETNNNPEAGAISPHALIVLFDGRFSLRCRQLLREKFPGVAVASPVDDAALLEHVWRADGAPIADLLHGDFAAAIYDRRLHRLWLLRSHSGARGLYVVQDNQRIAVATRASAALAAAGLPLREHPESIAAFFALRAPSAGAAYFKDVRALLPGVVCQFDAEDMHEAAIALPAASALPEFADDADAREAWLSVLSDAVAESLRNYRQPGVMLSGGLDSSALAAIGHDLRPDLLACSWILPGTPKSNEQLWIDATAAHLHLPTRSIEGDLDWPLARLSQWPVEDDGPPANPYCQLHQHLYRAAAAAGCDALMTGNFGDHLYPQADTGIVSGWKLHGAAWTLARYGTLLRQRGVRGLWQEPGWRTAIRGAGIARWAAPSWMLPDWRFALADRFGSMPPSAGADSAEAIQDAEFGRRFHCMHGIEMLAPYRDARVVEFAAALPAHFQYRPGQAKYLTREAMRTRLPESVRLRPKGGSLVAFFLRGVLEEEQRWVARLLDAADARWPNYISPQSLRVARERMRENLFTEPDLLLIWLCLSYELWWRAHWAGGPAVLASHVNSSSISEAFRD